MSAFRSPQVVLFSADPARAAGFYARLGFHEVFRTPAGGDPVHVDVELDGHRLASLASLGSTRDDHGLDPVDHGQRAAVVVWCDDVTTTYAALVADGVTGLRPPEPWLDRLLVAWLADPDGHPMQIVQERAR